MLLCEQGDKIVIFLLTLHFPESSAQQKPPIKDNKTVSHYKIIWETPQTIKLRYKARGTLVAVETIAQQ